MEAFAYFPALVYRDEKPEWVALLNEATQKHYARMANNTDPARQAWPLQQTASFTADPDLQFLCDYLLKTSVFILQDQGYAVDKYDFYLEGLWGQDIKCRGSTDMHIHKNSQITGWFFLETPEGGSYPVYQDTRINKAMIELDFIQGTEVSNATNSIHFNNVKPGTVLLANSWMPHQMTHSSADRETRTIHFIVSHRNRPCSTC